MQQPGKQKQKQQTPNLATYKYTQLNTQPATNVQKQNNTHSITHKHNLPQMYKHMTTLSHQAGRAGGWLFIN